MSATLQGQHVVNAVLHLQVRAHNLTPWLDKEGNPKAKSAGSASLVLDAPWTVHLPKMVLWVVTEAVQIFVGVTYPGGCARAPFGSKRDDALV